MYYSDNDFEPPTVGFYDLFLMLTDLSKLLNSIKFGLMEPKFRDLTEEDHENLLGHLEQVRKV